MLSCLSVMSFPTRAPPCPCPCFQSSPARGTFQHILLLPHTSPILAVSAFSSSSSSFFFYLLIFIPILLMFPFLHLNITVLLLAIKFPELNFSSSLYFFIPLPSPFSSSLSSFSSSHYHLMIIKLPFIVNIFAPLISIKFHLIFFHPPAFHPRPCLRPRSLPRSCQSHACSLHWLCQAGIGGSAIIPLISITFHHLLSLLPYFQHRSRPPLPPRC